MVVIEADPEGRLSPKVRLRLQHWAEGCWLNCDSTLSSLTWYRLARWWLVLIKNGWFTPGWSTSWAAAASSPSMMSRGVRKLASC